MSGLLFPEVCPVCMEPVLPKGRILHKDCEKRLSFIREPFCIKCGRPVADRDEAYCRSCGSKETFFDMGRCTFYYKSEIQTALKEVKSNGTRELVDFFGKITVVRQKSFLNTMAPECIVPVPLHKRKLYRRGFNQSELLAKAVSSYCGIPVINLLEKTKHTKEQKSLSGLERRDNLKDAFRVKKDAQVPGTVLIVDDIFTTGSTMDTCSYVLKQAGVNKVFFICMAAGTTDDWQ